MIKFHTYNELNSSSYQLNGYNHHNFYNIIRVIFSGIPVFFGTVRTTHTRNGTKMCAGIFIVPRIVPKKAVQLILSFQNKMGASNKSYS